MKVLDVRCIVGVQEFLQRCSFLSLSKSGASDDGGIDHCETPKMQSDGCWPVMFGKDKHGSGTIAKVSNAFLCNSTLVVGIDAAEADGLSGSSASSSEDFVGEDPVITVIMFDLHIVFIGVAFKSQPSGQNRFSIFALVQMYIFEPRIVVNKDRGVVILR